MAGPTYITYKNENTGDVETFEVGTPEEARVAALPNWHEVDADGAYGGSEFTGLHVTELRALATETYGLDVTGLKKAEIIEAINDAIAEDSREV